MRAFRLPVLLLVLAAALVLATGAAAASRAPHLIAIRCVPPSAKACAAGVKVRIGQQIQLRGQRLARGQRVTFRWSRGALATKLRRTRAGWVVRVPAGTRIGRVSVTVRDAHLRRSNAIRIQVVPTPAAPDPAPADGGLPAVFSGNGMWIWHLEQAEGGSPDAIAARAAAAGISLVIVKGADKTTPWPQFNQGLVAALHAHGLRVCAYHFIYGDDPVGEAAVSAGLVAQGADCLMVDAEKSYEGRYAAAQSYLGALRAAVGPAYPVGLTSFAYADYHPGFPYSVFLGPGGAQANVPQIYWKDFGETVDAASAHTLAHNRIYSPPIAPIGQAYASGDPAAYPPASDLQRFRAIWAAYGATGLSWWSWQHMTTLLWTTLGTPFAPTTVPDPGWPALHAGSKGDEVVWLQEHLASVAPAVSVSGIFDTATRNAVMDLQAQRGLAATGSTDAATWQQVLALPLAAQSWTSGPAGSRAAAAGVRRDRAPASAALPARGDEPDTAAARG